MFRRVLCLFADSSATHAFLEYERLTGDAASSPLVVRGGMPDQFAVGFGATHSFDIKTPW